MEQYSEFFTHRKPTEKGKKILRWWHERMLRIAQKHIPDLSQKNILEIGVGHGIFADICQRKKIAFTGIEMNQPQAQVLRQQGHEIITAKIPPIPAGEPVHVIWLSHMLEHATNYHEAREMLRACYERLTPNGYVVIIAPDIHHWKMDFWSVDWSHGFPTSTQRVEQVLHDAGFSVHKSMHHTLTITQPFLAWLSSTLLRLLIPVTLIDMFLDKTIKRKYAYSFMTVFGWRQIYLIGKKNHS